MHIDPYNHTGYAQVLEETTDDGVNVSTTYYTIGDDVLAQTVDGTTEYLLYDGHGSTRQLVDTAGAVVNDAAHGGVQSYSYDAYGVMLGGNPTTDAPKATNLLYSGEQFDANVSQYYLRARYYNQNNGTFNRVDPYSGNISDPQSLHKYAYVHNNPVNGIDPSGMMTLLSVASTISNIARAFIKYYPILKAGLVVADVLSVTNIVLKAITQGISSVTVGEWAELAIITGTAFFGGKAARHVSKILIRRALGLSDDVLKSFKGFSQFIKSKGIILEIDDLIKFNRKGQRVLGNFDFIGNNSDKPIIYLYKGGQTISTLIHEYVHYFQWKYFVGAGTKYDWLNFSSIGKTKEHLESIAYFVSDVFLK